MSAKGLRPRPSHVLYSIRWKLSSNTYPTGSKRHKYLERFFTLDLRCLDDRSTKRWFIGDSHGDAKRPLSSKFIAARDCYRRAGTINNIYTYRYHSLFRSCSFCCSRTGFTGKKKSHSSIQTRFNSMIFYSVHGRLYSHLPRNSTSWTSTNPPRYR